MSDEERKDEPGGLYGDQPSPEDIFAGDTDAGPVNVYLTAVNSGAPANVLKGIRAALSLLAPEGREARVPLSRAEAHLNAFNEGDRPRLLGWADSPQHAREVARAAVETSKGKLSIAIGLTAEDVTEIASAGEPPNSDPSDAEPHSANIEVGEMSPLAPTPLAPPNEDPHDPPSLAACKMAIALMAQHEGVGIRALFWARILAQTTGDEDWTGAARLLLASLPLKDPRS
jgi:hypothetical protein